MNYIRLKCSFCGGPKFVGDQYFYGGKYYVDVTCVICSDTKDIEVEFFKKFLENLEKKRSNYDKK